MNLTLQKNVCLLQGTSVFLRNKYDFAFPPTGTFSGMEEEEKSLHRPKNKESLSGAGCDEAVGFRMECNVRTQALPGNPKDNTSGRGTTVFSPELGGPIRMLGRGRGREKISSRL
ncbi:uncharacterized protein LOC144294738 [Canis aureus]